MVMLIVAVGYPHSGKSTFIDLLASFLKCSIIRPSDYYPADIATYSAEDRAEFQIAAWELAKERTIEALKSNNSHVVVFDTCGSNPESIRDVIWMASMRHHKTVAVWVATPRSVCYLRGDKKIIDKYIGKFEYAIRWYQSHFDEIVVVRDGMIPEWKQKAESIAKFLMRFI